MKFLVIQTAFLGDAVLVTSIVEKLHVFYPNAEIDLLVRKGNDGLFDEHPFIHRLFVWDKNKAKTKALFGLIGELRKVKYDHIINAQRFFSTGLMTVMAQGKNTIGYDKNPLSFRYGKKVEHVIGDGRHEVDRLNELIAPLTDNVRPLPRLYPTKKTYSEIEKAIGKPISEAGPYICVAPASVWYTKQWPSEKWVELIKCISVATTVFLIGAPGDINLCNGITKAAGKGTVLAGKLSLLGTAALMEKAAMNYVNDSAPLHIASAMNAPVTVIFCSTVPKFGFGPLRANGRIAETSVNLTCRPCGLHGFKECPEGHFKCALGVEVKAVLGAENF